MFKKRCKTVLDRTISNSLFFSKKGQITIFIIIGILLLLSLLIVVFVQKEIISFNPEEIVPTQKGKIENFISTCIENIGKDALFKVGTQGGYIEIPENILGDMNLHLKTSPFTAVPYWAYGENVNIPSLAEIKYRIDNFMEQNLRDCIFTGEVFQETYVLIEKSDLVANTEIVESKVIFNVNWNIEVRDKSGEVVTELINHVAESDVKLKKVHEMAARIIEKEMQNLKLEDIVQDLIALEHPDVPVAGIEMSCSKKTWDVNEVKSALLNLLRVNIKELKVKGTEFVEFPEELPYYQNHYVWDIGDDYINPDLSVAFNFDENYPFVFGVTPLSGSKMKSSQLGGTNLISLLCVQTWKFTYDVEFPVMVRVRDRTTGYDFNMAFTVHLVRNLPDRSGAVARDSFLVDTITDEDYCANMNIPMTVFTYETIDNGLVFIRDPLEEVKTSFTCIRYKCEMGETEYDYAGRGDIAGYTMNFPYCGGGILRGEKDGYKENWVLVEPMPGKEVELELFPLFEFSLGKVKIVKHEFNGVNDIGIGVPLEKEELALIKFYLKKDGTNFHEQTFVASDSLEEELKNQKIEFLGQADFEYQLEVNVISNDEMIGGYKQNWTVSWDELANADELEFHVLVKEDASDEDLFELMLGLEENSLLVSAPEFS